MGDGQIGSVFLQVSRLESVLEPLRVLLPHVPEGAPAEKWVEIPGPVDVFIEVVDDDEVPAAARFGIRVQDAARAHHELGAIPQVEPSELFEVAPGCQGFNVQGPGFPELFVHE
ncbi:MAG: hypothetical protein Q4G64_00930 [bacterium]|nr:hypothetical protein [bacterium]